MLRGTVWVYDERGVEQDRQVMADPHAIDVDDFRMTAANYHLSDSPLRRGWRIEFGPIGPPWRIC